MSTLTLEKGKYTVHNDNGLVTVDRYTEANWRSCTGDGFILALVQEIERLQERVKYLTDEKCELKDDLFEVIQKLNYHLI